MTKTTMTDGSPVTPDHRDLKPNGQQKGYVVLSEEERAKGFVRPVRDSYVHIGAGPTYPVHPLTKEEEARFEGLGYVYYEAYPPELAPLKGRYWKPSEITEGCGAVTTMAHSIAETYARDPSFYGGTFCIGCGKHLRVGRSGEFVWQGTIERVGT